MTARAGRIGDRIHAQCVQSACMRWRAVKITESLQRDNGGLDPINQSGRALRTPSPRRGEGWGEGGSDMREKLRHPNPLTRSLRSRPLPSGER